MSLYKWADDYLAAHPEQTAPKPPSTGMAKAVGTSVALGVVVPLVGLVAAPFLMFKPLVRMGVNTAEKQRAEIAAQAAPAMPARRVPRTRAEVIVGLIILGGLCLSMWLS